MNQSRLAYLFQRYIDNTCTEAELDEFLFLVKESEESSDMESILDKYWEESSEIEMNSNRSAAILEKTYSYQIEKPNKSLINRLKWIGYAAAIIVISFTVWQINENKDKPLSKLTYNRIEKQITPKNEFITVSTTFEHQKVTLPDSSTVILNNNSSLTFPKVFGHKRVVKLVGEGYFDVKHDDKKSFTVYTGKLRTTVLGTAFNIKANSADKNIVVTVTRGKVGVIDGNTTIGILKPNDQIIFNKDYKKTNLNKVIAKNIVQWQESDLYFDDVSMEQAIQILSKKFNTPIALSNEQTKKCRFTATFLKGESLQEILKIICSYNNAQYKTGAGGITIQGEGCE